MVDGVPPIDIDIEKLKLDLSKRSPGKDFTSKRIELDLPEIVSKFFENKTNSSQFVLL
ncbi:MAG: chorismate synthase [Saprospiraceae bacterium]|nr:chorismate synthase [Saprospiraceae bacterium]